MEEKIAKLIVYVLGCLIALFGLLMAWFAYPLTKILIVFLFAIPLFFLFRFKNWARIMLTIIIDLIAIMVLQAYMGGFRGFSDSNAPISLTPYNIFILTSAIIISYFLLINKDVKKLFQNNISDNNVAAK